MNKKVLSLAVPSILANITVPLVGMADLAIAGRLGDAATIGGIAIATMLFDLLYWNMGFLRVGTGGIAAQAYGRGDNRAAMTVLTRASGTALASALVILALQLLFVNTAFVFIECTPEVENLAREYFFIRIWAAPATLMLFVFKGWCSFRITGHCYCKNLGRFRKFQKRIFFGSFDSIWVWMGMAG